MQGGGEDSVRVAKAELRKRMIAQRAQLPAPVRGAGAVAIGGHVRALLAAALTVDPRPADRSALAVSGFLPIGEEVDPRPAMQAARALGHPICLPVMAGKGKPLIFRCWEPGEPLVERMWGIREPADSAPEISPDVLLMPLLAFDAAGGRLGYGGGFYDRTLQALRQRGRILAAGLAFDQQRIDAVPRLDYDEPLDLVVTPSGVIDFRPAR